MPQGWDLGDLRVKSISVGICDGATSTARSSFHSTHVNTCLNTFIEDDKMVLEKSICLSVP